MPANITFPTDTKLLTTVYDKLVDYIKKNKENLKIKVIRGYRKIKKFTRNFNLKKNKTKKEITKARKKLVRAGKNLLKKIKDKAGNISSYVLDIAEKILIQQDERNKQKKNINIIKDRIVSFHEPFVRPIKRSKDNAKCEFGKKVGLSTIGEGILVTTTIDNNNFDDRKLIPEAIKRHEEITGRLPSEMICDRGGDSKQNHDQLKEKNIKDGVQRKGKLNEKPSRMQKRQRRRRSVIEGKIGTAKQWYGLNKNKYKEEKAQVWSTFCLAAMNLTWGAKQDMLKAA